MKNTLTVSLIGAMFTVALVMSVYQEVTGCCT